MIGHSLRAHNFYYTDEIKFGTRQDEGNSQEATKTFFEKPKSQNRTKKTVNGEEESSAKKIVRVRTSLPLIVS